MKRPLLLIGVLCLLALLSIPAIIFYLDWRIPRATATIQVHPAVLSTTTGPSSGLSFAR